MRFNLLATLCALLATTQLAIAADPPRPPTPPNPNTNRQNVADAAFYTAAACGIGAIICTANGQSGAGYALSAASVCCGLAGGKIANKNDQQWDASVKKYGDKAKATCNKIKEGVFLCGEWVVEMVGGVWQVVRRATTAERHFIPRKRAHLARSIDGLKTKGRRKMRRSSRGGEARDRMPLRL
ncbi:hypothetical protein V2G26_009954 [Clonostachys chloroleuca]